MSIGLTEQILNLVDFVCCVDSNKNGTDFGCCPECDEPLRKVCEPYSNLVAGFYAESNECSCAVVNIVSEL